MKPPLFTELTADRKEKAFLLKNPKTSHYAACKDQILGKEFNWNRLEKSPGGETDSDYDDFPFLSHNFLIRPGGTANTNLYSMVSSQNVLPIQQLFREIAKHNGLDPKVIYMMTANAVYPTEYNLPFAPHVNHKFPHYTMMVYLTNPQGGSTIVDGQEYDTEEDDVLIFDGQERYCTKPPSKNIRISLIMTFL